MIEAVLFGLAGGLAILFIRMLAGDDRLTAARDRALAQDRVARARATSIADRAPVTVIGRIVAYDRTLASPLTGTECVAYWAVALLSGATENEAHLSYTQTESVPFLLESSAGMVLVEARDAEIVLFAKPVAASERTLAFVTGRRPEANPRAYTFREVSLEVGSTVTVQGIAVIELDQNATEERGYRDDVPQRIRVVGDDKHRLTIGRPRR